MPGSDQLTALDAAFLELEQADDGALMHIGAALVFDPLPGGGTPAIGEVREHLEQRLELLPRYRQKLGAPRTGGLAWPSWERDQRFEIDAHVRHATLPSPGDEPEFLDWISDFYSHRLDRGRPLWEIVLLDGLAGGRWALVSKTHHCLVDGVGSVDVVDLLLGAKPRAARAVSAPRAGVGLGLARMAPASTRACRPGGRRRPLGRSGRRARAGASA
jgi:diacylglycerol O-acyltransferase / wax synthase